MRHMRSTLKAFEHRLKRRAVVRVILGSAALSSFVSAGCTVYSPAESDQAEWASADLPAAPFPESAWPERVTSGLDAIAAAARGPIFMWKLDGSRIEADYSPDMLARVSRPEAVIEHAGRYGVGVVRAFAPEDRQGLKSGSGLGAGPGTIAAAPSADKPAPTGSPARLRFISVSTLENKPKDERYKSFARWMDRLGSRSWNGVKLNDPGIVRAIFEGVRVQVLPPTRVSPGGGASVGGDAGGARGSVIYLSGLGSAKYEQPVVDELRNQGWWIIQIATPSVWWFENSKFEIHSRDDLPRVAADIARVVDDVIAEPAFAAEAVLEYLKAQRPDVPVRPLAMLACSAGALAGPAVAARLGDDLDAAVLIGGGANLLRISQESELTNGGITLVWPGGGSAPEGWLKELYQNYLEASQLDPYRTAPSLEHKPTLAVLANMDTIVPAETGRLLWEQLGRPERYRYTFGHSLMFYTLSDQSGRLTRWINAAVSKPASSQ